MTPTGLEVTSGERPAPLRIGALLGVLVSTALVALAIVSISEAMRYVMSEQGGFCASGGPYEIRPGNECTGGTIALLMGGSFGGLAAAGLATFFAARAGGPRTAAAAAGLGWAALFGLLGWNFLDLGFDQPGDSGPVFGWLIPGILFWLMTLPGLGVLVALIKAPTARGPKGPTARIVRARAFGGQSADPEAPAAYGRRSVLAWLVATAGGATAGVVAGLALAETVL